MKTACGPNDSGARTRLLTVAGDLSAIGGAEIAQLRIVEGLASAGWAVELQYVSRGDLWPRWNSVASSTRIIRASGLQRSEPLRSSRGVAEAWVGTMRSQAQVLYVHNPGDLPAALMAARMKRIPVVAHLHLPPPFRQPKWLNGLIKMADAVIAPSSDTAERWTKIAGLSHDQVTVIPTGIDTGHFAPIGDAERDEQRRALGIDPVVPMILFAGRLDPTKGLPHLLEALQHMEVARQLGRVRGRHGCRVRRPVAPSSRGEVPSPGSTDGWTSHRCWALPTWSCCPAWCSRPREWWSSRRCPAARRRWRQPLEGCPRPSPRFRTTWCLPATRLHWPQPSTVWSAGAGTRPPWAMTRVNGSRTISPLTVPSGPCLRCWPESGKGTALSRIRQ